MPRTQFHMAQSCPVLKWLLKGYSIFQLMFWLHPSAFKPQLLVSWLGRFPPIDLLVVWLIVWQHVQAPQQACRPLGGN